VPGAAGARAGGFDTRLRRYSTREQGTPAALLNPRGGAAYGAAQPTGRRCARPCSTRGAGRTERYSARIPETTSHGAEAAGAEVGGFRYAPAALLNPRGRAAYGAAQPARLKRHLVSPGRAVSETTGAQAGGGRVSIRACGATQPARRSGLLRYSTRGRSRLRRYSARGTERAYGGRHSHREEVARRG
jgi:hypothetical protein